MDPVNSEGSEVSTTGPDDKKPGEAKDILRNALVGLGVLAAVVIAFAYTAVTSIYIGVTFLGLIVVGIGVKGLISGRIRLFRIGSRANSVYIVIAGIGILLIAGFLGGPASPLK